ncbi:Exonuclease III [Jannaschia seohaensis]|uniref:Exonuclease III n=2 Tax=Jannaschia seohaensis TaxID=475081 RepID=A0A2Y9ANG3_9RHOB|nr:exonuclease III [Jannaschia seohaensis]SSA46011.1 Exonuclease III [Jannaschia seohaensis]
MLRPTDLARADRVETAKVIASAQADILALQEVFDLAALDFFHDRFLLAAGLPGYPHRYCFKGNDGRGLNVAAMSRQQPVSTTSHAELTGADLGLADLPADLHDRPIFRRDCLQLEFGSVTLFVCHFKAPYPDAAKARLVREAEARSVRKIVEARFADPMSERWIILGDFNEPARADVMSRSALQPLKSNFAVDLLDRLTPGTDWTYDMPDKHLHSRPDRIFVSPRLAEEYPDVRPHIIRSGMQPVRQISPNFQPFWLDSGPHASDHALVYADFPGL